MVLFQSVQYDVGTRSAVVDVAQYVQLVNGQSLYDITECNDEVVSTSSRDNGVYDDTDIGSLVRIVRTLV